MAKNKKKPDYSKEYEEIVKAYGLENLTPGQIADFLIDAGVNLTHSIGFSADSIKINGLKLAASTLNRKLRKNRWVEMVSDGVSYNKAMSHEKVMKRLDENIAEQKSDNMLRRSIRKTFNNANGLMVPIETDTQLIPVELKQNEKLDEIYKSCVETREYINEYLWHGLFDKFAKAFQHLLNYTVDAHHYKVLVDDRYYMGGDDTALDSYGNQKADKLGRTEKKIKEFANFVKAFAAIGNVEYLNHFYQEYGIKIEYTKDDLNAVNLDDESYYTSLPVESLDKLDGLRDLVKNPFKSGGNEHCHNDEYDEKWKFEEDVNAKL